MDFSIVVVLKYVLLPGAVLVTVFSSFLIYQNDSVQNESHHHRTRGQFHRKDWRLEFMKKNAASFGCHTTAAEQQRALNFESLFSVIFAAYK